MRTDLGRNSRGKNQTPGAAELSSGACLSRSPRALGIPNGLGQGSGLAGPCERDVGQGLDSGQSGDVEEEGSESPG